MSRSTVTKADLAKVREFLRESGYCITGVEVRPGRVIFSLSSGDILTAGAGGEFDRAREAEDWSHGKRTRTKAA